MLFCIADIHIEIEQSLLCKKVREYLQPFVVNKNLPLQEYPFFVSLSNTSDFRTDIESSTRMGSIQYQEYDSTIIVNDTFSCIKIDIVRKCMQIYPKAERYLQELDFVTDLKVLLSLLVLEKGGILLHSSAVVHNDSSLIFSGPSGAGKSTIAQLLCPPYALINDEFNILTPLNSSLHVFSTPYGKIKGTHKHCASVQKLFLIFKHTSNKIYPLTPKESFFRIAANVCSLPTSDYYGNKLLENMQNIIDAVPVYELYFINDRSLIGFINSLDNV